MSVMSAVLFLIMAVAVGCTAAIPVATQSPKPSAPAVAIPTTQSPSPPPLVAMEQVPALVWGIDIGRPSFGDPALVKGTGFRPGSYTLWIGPPRAGTPTCVPEDAVALETVSVDERGTFAHGFTIRESWGSWTLRATDFFRIYAAPGVERCPVAARPVVLAMGLSGHGNGVGVGDYPPCASDRVGETYHEANVTNFYAPAKAMLGTPVTVVVRFALNETCIVPCPEALKAVVDESTRTVWLEAASLRLSAQGCLGMGSEAELETSFLPASTGVYTVRARINNVSYAGGSRDHLSFPSPRPSSEGVEEAFSTVVVQ